MAWEQLPASLEATKQRRRRRRRPGSVRRRQVGGRSAAGQNCVLVWPLRLRRVGRGSRAGGRGMGSGGRAGSSR